MVRGGDDVFVVAGDKPASNGPTAIDGGGAPLLRPLRGSLSLGGYVATPDGGYVATPPPAVFAPLRTSLGGPAWTANALPTNMTSLAFHPLSAADAADLDRDGDGLSIADELFVHGTDPDDGDGIRLQKPSAGCERDWRHLLHMNICNSMV